MIICTPKLCNRKTEVIMLVLNSLSSLAWGKSVTFGTCTCSCASANSPKLKSSRVGIDNAQLLVMRNHLSAIFLREYLFIHVLYMDSNKIKWINFFQNWTLSWEKYQFFAECVLFCFYAAKIVLNFSSNNMKTLMRRANFSFNIHVLLFLRLQIKLVWDPILITY